jgi:cysteine desulfurase / selenocysteine lyase
MVSSMRTLREPHPTPGARALEAAAFDVARVREDFPVLRQTVYGKPLVYLDNAATAQKPRQVIDRIAEFYAHENSTVRRGVHYLSQKATLGHEEARARIASFLNAGDVREVVLVRGTTEAINLVANGFALSVLKPGDEVLVTEMEHHANIVPWQMACQRSGAVLRVVPIDDRGDLMMDELEALITDRTRILAVTHISNALGTVNPVRRIVEIAHAKGVPVLVDGAQGVLHSRVDVREIGCDFYAFSGHKIYGPTGIGALYGRAEWLEKLPPYQGGGDMILSVTFEKTVYNAIPHKFEAGTPAIAEAIGLGAALEYVSSLGIDRIAAYESDLLEYATAEVSGLEGVRIIGTARERAGVLGFTIDGVHPHDVGTILDQEGIAIRAGHHCAQPVMKHFGVPATARASFSFYNTRDEVDALVAGIRKCIEVFA